MKSRINRDEREISISELWWYVISKWKWLVMGMVVGALLMGAFGAYKAYSANNAETPKKITMEDLTTEEQAEVKALIEDYEFYKAEEERLKNNYLMNLDYNNISYYLVTYYVDTDYSYNYMDVQENYAATLISMYKTYITSDEMRSAIKSLGIENLEEIDISYLFASSSEANIVRFAVYADDEWSKKILDVMCSAFEEYHSVAEELVGEHKLIKVSEDSRISYVEHVKNGQNFKAGIVNKLKTEIETTKTEFTQEQLLVYEKEISGTTEEENKTNNVNGVFSKKHIVLGAVGGILAGAVIAVVVYLTGKKIKSINDIKQVYGVEILGKIMRDCVAGDKAVKKINKIKGSMSEKEQQEYVAEMIANKCKRENINDIVICSTVDAVNGKLVELINTLKELGIKCEITNNIGYDNKALNAAVECKNIILSEQLNVTNRDDLENEIEICDKLSLNILGMIVII